MSWQKIKQAAQDARSHPQQYMGLLGDSKFLYTEEVSAKGVTVYGTYRNPIPMTLIAVNPTLSGVQGCGFVFLGAISYVNTYQDSDSSNLVFSKSYAANGYFAKGGEFFAAVDSNEHNRNFSDLLLSVTYNCVNSFTPYTDRVNATPPGTVNGVFPIAVTSTVSKSALAVPPSFFDFVNPSSHDSVFAQTSYDTTFQDNCRANAYIRQCSIGYMPSAISIIMENNSSNSGYFATNVVFRELLNGRRVTSSVQGESISGGLAELFRSSSGSTPFGFAYLENSTLPSKASYSAGWVVIGPQAVLLFM